jgi:phosphoribosylaminoimidazole-succinocarboxamide synthase
MATGSVDYASHIQKHIGDTLDSFNIQFPTSLGPVKHHSGKVRDAYEINQSLLLVTTDRVSAFDRILAKIPFKGQVLNQVSLWWFDKTKHIVQNHVQSCPDPNAVVGKKCRVFPVEFVVRGYMTGTTSTSIWTNYAKGVREYCGHSLPDGLQKNQKLHKNLVTPTTKDDDHDRLITPAEIISEGRMTVDHWQKCHDIALALFEFGQKTSLEHGLLLVDTKYEFGLDENGASGSLIRTQATPVLTLSVFVFQEISFLLTKYTLQIAPDTGSRDPLPTDSRKVWRQKISTRMY